MRLWDRILDLYVHTPMQAFVADLLRPEGQRDPLAIPQATERLTVAYDLLEERLAGRSWLVGDAFSLADCAAAPPSSTRTARPFGERAALAAYFDRLKARPSYARVLRRAEPFPLVPR